MRHWSFHYLISLGIAVSNTLLLTWIFRLKTQDGETCSIFCIPNCHLTMQRMFGIGRRSCRRNRHKRAEHISPDSVHQNRSFARLFHPRIRRCRGYHRRYRHRLPIKAGDDFLTRTCRLDRHLYYRRKTWRGIVRLCFSWVFRRHVSFALINCENLT